MGLVSNKRWSDEELLQRRKDVLSGWPTGRAVDLEEAIEYHRRLPKHRVFTNRVQEAQKKGEILVEVGLGHTTAEETGEHLAAVRDAGADLVMFHTDTYTRKNRYEDAEKALEESKRSNRSMLNGFPIVCYGVEESRRVFELGDIAIEGYSADEDPTLTWEIALAAGATANFNHDLQELVLHSKRYPLDKRIQNSQYIARLAAYYTERGAPVHVHSYALMHGYCPPSLNIAIAVLNLLLTVGQGVRHTGLCHALQGHLVQDVAALRACRELGEEYLQRFGYRDLDFTLSSWPFMGDWPKDLARASGFASMFAVASALAPVEYIYQKSVEEALGITKFQGNVTVTRLTKQVNSMVKNLGPFDNAAIREEKDVIVAEARCILDRVIEMGEGDPQVGEIRAVEAGVLDVPFSSWLSLKGKVLPVRDATGAMRYLETGGLPFTKELIERNTQKVAEREAKEHPGASLDMLVKDIKLYSEEFVAANCMPA
ncbi:MAG: hypothetical protein EPO21_03575 [Chloroflexota bacterium]|nr:MAG: hypothetical protein EPO21_03575 [Chloroflexota bacterium]